MPASVRRAEFPADFQWGAATAAYQVEGGNATSDLWDWERRRGWELSGPAVDSWNRYGEDIALLKQLGANTYRFSIEWGRVMPSPGKVYEPALERYGRMFDALEAAGITPVVTLHHFTNPRWFWQKHPNGWGDATAVDSFLEFVKLIAERFGGRVRSWVTFNEPMVYVMNGLISGHFPPGKRQILKALPESFMPAVGNIARAHRGAYRLLAPTGAQVGMVQNISAVEPWKQTPRHAGAARRWDDFFHWNLLEAAKTGALDFDLEGRREPVDEPGPGLDFVGVNYYTRVYVRAFPLVMAPVHAFPFHAEVTWDPLGKVLFWLAGGKLGPGPKDELGHEIYPEGIRLVAKAAWQRLGLPVMITENGVADAADALRRDYILAHLRELKAALDEGVPVKGYLHWSLMDNYEWGSFKPRLGLYRVDRAAGFKRELTAGGRAYQEFLLGT